MKSIDNRFLQEACHLIEKDPPRNMDGAFTVDVTPTQRDDVLLLPSFSADFLSVQSVSLSLVQCPVRTKCLPAPNKDGCSITEGLISRERCRKPPRSPAPRAMGALRSACEEFILFCFLFFSTSIAAAPPLGPWQCTKHLTCDLIKKHRLVQQFHYSHSDKLPPNFL